MEAQENKLTKTDVAYMIAMILICISVVFLHLKYINIICVLDIMLCVLSIVLISARIFLWKVKWFAVGFDKKVLIYNEENIIEKMKK